MNRDEEMARLCDSINDICRQSDVSLDEIFKSSKSILGKLYELFLSLKNQNDYLGNSDLIIKINERIKFNQMNFIQFIQQIEILAKENHVSKEYIYKKLLHQTLFNNNENNNAFDSSIINHNILFNEYKNDLFRLKTCFRKHCDKSKENSNHQMSCSMFIKWISENLKFNNIDNRLELNDIFYKIYSLLVNQGVYIPASHTIDFHGFILCLQQIARTFHFNLRILIKNLIHPYDFISS